MLLLNKNTDRSIITPYIISALTPELSKIFEHVSVEVAQCPNLIQPPFYLAAEGK